MASVKDMLDWGFRIDGCRQISEHDYKELVRNGCKPKKGDVLLAKDGNTYLKYIFAMEEDKELVILSSIALLRPSRSILPRVLSLALREPMTKARLAGLVSGVAIPRIVLKDFRKFQIIVAPIDIQAKWAKYADPFINMLQKLGDEMSNLRRTRDLLLPRLLSGQIEQGVD